MAAPDELTLLERVFLRVGSAETDDQLQNAVAKFLLPVLLKLSSQQEGVRKKVMELLVHINKRIKCRPKIQLPVEALLLQYQDPAATSFVTNFTIIYIKMGFPRLEIEKQSELLSIVLTSIDGKPQSHQDSLLLMIMPVLGHVKIPSDVQKRKCLFGLHEKPKVAQLLLEFMLDVLLLPYGPLPAPPPSVPDAPPAAVLPFAVPGLSENAYKRATSDSPLTPEDLEKTKIGIVKFLGGGFLPDEDIAIHLIVASSDTRHSVVNAAELELRRSLGSNEYSTMVINKLYAMFLGTITVKDQKPVIKPENKRSAANPRIRMKILPHLLKSREAAICFPACIQMVFDCLYGTNTNAKLKMMAVQFVHHICLHCSDARLSPIGPILMSGMLKLINSAVDEPKLRSIAYIAIGKLGCKLPQLVTKDLVLVQKFFDSMSVENQDTKLAIQEALSIMRYAFKNLDPANLKMMHALLASNMEKPEPQVRLIAVQYVSSVFPSSDIPSRYLLLLAAGDTKEEVYAEAAKALQTVPTKSSGAGKQVAEPIVFPPFTEIVCFISEKAESRMKSKQYYTVGSHKLPFTPATCTEAMTYMRLCLVHSAGLEPSLDQEMRDQAPTLSKYVCKLLKEQPREKGAIQLYIDFIKQFLSVINGTASMYYLLEIVAVAPKVLAAHVVPQLDWIKGFVFSTKEEMRHNASQLFAIVVAHGLDSDKRTAVIQDLSKCLHDKSLEKQHGAALALGFVLARLAHLNGQKMGDNVLEKVSNGVTAVKELAGLLTNSQSALVSAACTALGEIGRNGVLPLPDDGGDGEVTKLSIVKALKDILKSNKHTAKHQEKAALAASYLCVGDAKFPHSRVVIEGFLESGREQSNVDLAFTIGEALSWCALGSLSPVARDFWSTSEDEFLALKKKKGSGSTLEHLQFLLQEIMTKYTTSQNPNVRQASCVWLLCLLKQCKDYPAVKEKLEELQNVFTNLLSETNDITQDSASKGLGLIYEYCEEQQRSKLVAVLVETLMSGRRAALQVTDDTKIFEEGTLGSNPLGGGLSTYKELCSLASDLSKPDLIYQFMNLANHNAIWNSKKGAAFGFGIIAAKAGEQLQSHLPVIIPKLFRYQFDPNIKIQQSMTSIWNSIVTDSQKTVDLYVKEILADLKVNLTNNAWRTRESSCLALADLLRGRQLELFVDDLPELWEICFRVRDDVKETVRTAAEAALKALSKVLTKLCDTHVGPVGQKAIASVLPVLLKSGLMSPVIEVRTISLATLTKIGKSAGVLLKPHIPLLTVSLLESLSALEQQEFNYLSVRLGNQQNTQERFDSARIAASRSSPMMDTINQCLPFVNETILEELIPRVIDLIKSSVGLSTKAGCAHLVTMLTHHCLALLSPHAGRLLAALLFGLNDRSLAVRKCYSNAIGNLVKAAKDSSVEKLIDRLKTSYLEKDEAAARHICGHVLHSIATQSPDVLKLHSAQVLSLAFLAMHSPKLPNGESEAEDKSDNETWEEIWGDLTAGMEAGVRLYMVEIVDIIQLANKSPDWNMKVRVALAIATVASKMKSSLTSPHLEVLLDIATAGIPGRVWEGKQHVLKAVSVICVECKESVLGSSGSSNSPVDVNEIVSSLLKECGKDNIKYQKEAIQCTVDVLFSYKIDRFKEIFTLVQQIQNKSKRQDDDDDEDAKTRKSPEVVALQEVAFLSLGIAWPAVESTQDLFQQELCDFLCSTLEQHPQKVQVSILKTVNHFVERLHILSSSSSDVDAKLSAILAKLVPQICTCAESTKSSFIRKEVVDIFDHILSKLKGNEKLHLVEDQLERFKVVLTQIVQESQTEIREKGNQVLKFL